MNKKEGKTTKRIFASFLTAALLLGLLSVGASAEETKYKPLTLSNCCGAALTIDKAHVLYAGKLADKNGENFRCPIYGVPDGAKITVTVTGAQGEDELYIGAKFDLLSNGGNASTGGIVMKSAEYVCSRCCLHSWANRHIFASGHGITHNFFKISCLRTFA